MVPQQQGDSRGYNSQVCRHRLTVVVATVILSYTPVRAFFEHASPHDTLGHGLNTKLCALGSDSMCSEHFGHVKS